MAGGNGWLPRRLDLVASMAGPEKIGGCSHGSRSRYATPWFRKRLAHDGLRCGGVFISAA